MKFDHPYEGIDSGCTCSECTDKRLSIEKNKGLNDPDLYSFGCEIASIGASCELEDAIKEIRAWRRLFEIDGLDRFDAKITDKRIEVKVECPMENSGGKEGLIMYMHEKRWGGRITGPKWIGEYMHDVRIFEGVFVRYGEAE